MSYTSDTILLVEDNEDDVFLLKRGFQHAGIVNPLKIVTDGQQAIDYLSGTGEFADRNSFPLPGLVLLDLKLPYLDGFEVLEWIRAHPVLKTSAVVILTSSPENRDRKRAAELGAQGYLVKPASPASLLEVTAGVRSAGMADDSNAARIGG
jgi:CheY-like chemotaxis protein